MIPRLQAKVGYVRVELILRMRHLAKQKVEKVLRGSVPGVVRLTKPTVEKVLRGSVPGVVRLTKPKVEKVVFGSVPGLVRLKSTWSKLWLGSTLFVEQYRK